MENKTCLKPPTSKVPKVHVMFDGHPSQVSMNNMVPCRCFPNCAATPRRDTELWKKKDTQITSQSGMLSIVVPQLATGNWMNCWKKYDLHHPKNPITPSGPPKNGSYPDHFGVFSQVFMGALRVIRSYGSITSVSILQSKLPQFKLDSFTHHISM